MTKLAQRYGHRHSGNVKGALLAQSALFEDEDEEGAMVPYLLSYLSLAPWPSFSLVGHHSHGDNAKKNKLKTYSKSKSNLHCTRTNNLRGKISQWRLL